MYLLWRIFRGQYPIRAISGIGCTFRQSIPFDLELNLLLPLRLLAVCQSRIAIRKRSMSHAAHMCLRTMVTSTLNCSDAGPVDIDEEFEDIEEEDFSENDNFVSE